MRRRRSSGRAPLVPSAFVGFRFPPEVILLAVRWYLRYGLSYRDVEELLAERGVEVDHMTLFRWVQRFTPGRAGDLLDPLIDSQMLDGVAGSEAALCDLVDDCFSSPSERGHVATARPPLRRVISPRGGVRCVESGSGTRSSFQVLERQINPSIAAHGGHADLVAVEDDAAYLRLSGGCAGCGMAAVTLSQGIEVAIKESVPEIVKIVDVTDHAAGTNPYYEAAKK